MNNSFHDFYDEMSPEHKEEIRKKILSGGTPSGAARHLPRGGRQWQNGTAPRRKPSRKLILANVAAAACLALVTVLLLALGQSAPAPLTAMPGENWVYYPANEYGLFRVNEDGSVAEKVEAATDILPAGANHIYVNNAEVLGDWVYYSVQYSINPVVPEFIDIYRLRIDGTGRPQPLVERNETSLLNFKIWKNAIYWSDNAGLHKMQGDGSGKTLLAGPEGEPSWLNWGHPFALVDGWAYYAWHEGPDEPACIWRTDTDGNVTEQFAGFTEETPYVMLSSFEGNWIYYIAAEGGDYQIIKRLSTLSRETQVLVTRDMRVMGFLDEFTVSGDWLYYPHCGDLWDWGPLYRVNMNTGQSSVLVDEACRNIWVLGGKVYFYTFNQEDNWKPYFYRMNLDGSDRQTLGALDEPAWKFETPTETPDPDAPTASVWTDSIVLVTDYGQIDDQSYNQMAWEGLVQFAERFGVDNYGYYRPADDTDEARIEAIENAIENGAITIVCPGILFGIPVYKTQKQYPGVNFLLVDWEPHDEIYTFETAPNTHCLFFREEQGGYLAGYAAVMEGYTKLGFLGGMETPAVVRNGYGFLQGANDAAKVKGNAAQIEVKYWYSGVFWPTDDIKAKMTDWYAGGTEVVFAAGGGIYLSADAAALAKGGKLIGVDVDQAGESERFITSAMKDLARAVERSLKALQENGGKWDETRAGKTALLGAAEGCITLPTAPGSWRLSTFTVAQYEALLAKIASGAIEVSDDCDNKPAVTISVNWQ